MTSTGEELMRQEVEKLRPEAKRLWVEALRSGRYLQGRRYLKQGLGGDVERHCCLGVLCEVALEAGVPIRSVVRTASRVTAFEGNTIIPPAPVMEWAWGNDRAALRIPYPEEGDDHPSLVWEEFTDLNDRHRLTFDQIADLIEEYM